LELTDHRILLTGGGGFIGSHLAERLVAAGNTVVIYDNFHRDSLKYAQNLQEHAALRIVRGDVLDMTALQHASEKCDIIVHLAAIAGVSSYHAIPAQTLRVNILGTINALEAARMVGVKRFIDVSTSECYGPSCFAAREDDNHVIGPVHDSRWTYALSKLVSENFTLRMGQEYGMACVTVRPFNVYGPRQTGEGAVANFCRAMVRRETLKVTGDGTAIRAWCYIDDFIDGMIAVLGAQHVVGEVFNLGNPQCIRSTLGLAEDIVRLTGGNACIELIPMPYTEIQVRTPSISKAQMLLGFEPKIALGEGLRRTLDWFYKVQA
jgi:nucleoside-diphosphate-sugar epimerase